MIDRIRQAEEFYEQGDKFDAAGDTDRAIHEWRRAIDLNPNHFGAHYNLGIAYADAGNADDAIDELNMAHALDPDDKDAPRELVSVLIERSEERNEQGNRIGAAADWNRVLEIDSHNPKIHYFLGQADMQDKDYTSSIRHFRAAISSNRFYTDAYIQLADAYRLDDRPREAIDILRQALNVFHSNQMHRGVILADEIKGPSVNRYVDVSELARKLARLQLEYNDPNQAMAALENAAPSQENAALWQDIANDFEARGDSESAEIAANRAAEASQAETTDDEAPDERIQTGVAEDHYQRGEKLYEQGAPEDAFEAYSKAVELDPDHVGAHYGIGVIYQDDEEYALAEQEFREVLRIDPDHSDAHFALGEIFDGREDWQDAAAEYRQVLRVSPGDQDAEQKLVWDLLELNDVTQGQMELERATLDAPIASELWAELGKAYEERGARGSAIAAYQRALGLDKKAKIAREGLKRLGVN